MLLAGVVKAADQLAWRWGGYPGSSGWEPSNCTHESLKEKKRQKRGSERRTERDFTCGGFEDEGATSQGMRVASGSQKRQEADSPLGLSERTAALLVL